MMIYAINKQTKEHEVAFSNEAHAAENAFGGIPEAPNGYEFVEADDDGWIPWNGYRECPLPVGHPYQVTFAYEKKIDNNVPIERQPDTLDWYHSYSGGDIIAYRPILEESSGISRTPIMDSYRESQESKETEWDGEGLPPVGVECETYINSRDCWATVRIVAHDGDVAIFKNGVGHLYAGGKAGAFRPIRSEGDRAVDALAMDILDTVNRDGVDFEHHEKRMAERLYVMGYRKVED